MTDAFEAKAAALTAAWQERVKARQAQAIAASEPHEVPLPSGLTVMAVRADMRSLLEAGKLPDSLTGYALSLLNVGRTGGEASLTPLLTEQLAEWNALMDAMWLSSVVAPKFVANGVMDGTAIPMRQVEFEDKVAFFNWSNGVSDHLAAFRDAGDVARTAPDRESLRSGPGAAGGDQSGDGVAARLEPQTGDVLRGHNRRKPAQGNAAGADAGPGAGAEGDALVARSEVDLAASRGARSAAARRGARRRTDAAA